MAHNSPSRLAAFQEDASVRATSTTAQKVAEPFDGSGRRLPFFVPLVQHGRLLLVRVRGRPLGQLQVVGHQLASHGCGDDDTRPRAFPGLPVVSRTMVA